MSTPHEGIEDARSLGALNPKQPVTVDLVMRPEHDALVQQAMEVGEEPLTSALTPSEAVGRYGYGDAHETVLDSFAREHSLAVHGRDPISGLVTVSGDAAAIKRTFGVELERYEGVRNNRRVEFRSYDGDPVIPLAFEGYFDGVMGLSTAPIFNPRNVVGPRFASPRADDKNAAPPYHIADVARAYGVRQSERAHNQTIGIIVLGGGYLPRVIAEYCARVGVMPPSSLRDIGVGRARNHPSFVNVANSEDVETYLDIQVAIVYAPGVNIVCYFAPNTMSGFLKAVARAVNDNVTAVSVSWGAPAVTFTPTVLLAWERVATMGVAMEIPILAAAGDEGSGDGLPGVNVDAPACVPSVVAVGATSLPAQNRSLEVAWPNTGGGVGAMNAPPRQQGLLIPHAVTGQTGGRVVPDVSISGDPKYGYPLLIPDGAGWQWYPVGGSSAGPPAISGMHADLTQELQNHKPGERIGDLNSLAYALWAPGGGLQDIVSGSNGAYHAGPGFDAVTGLGSPNFGLIRQLTLGANGVRAPQRGTPPTNDGLAA
jgi:kumamolisin